MEQNDSLLGKDQNFLHDQIKEEKNLNNDDKQRDKGTKKSYRENADTNEEQRTYAGVTIRRNILSLDFKLKKPFNISPAYLGEFCMSKLGITREEIIGVHRYGIANDRMEGYLKIKTKREINVSKRFQAIKGIAEDEMIILNIRGYKHDDGMKLWRVLSPHEDLALKTIEEGLGDIAEKKGDIFPEKFR